MCLYPWGQISLEQNTPSGWAGSVYLANEIYRLLDYQLIEKRFDSEGLNLSFNNLGLLYLTLKNFSKSEELLNQALDLKGEKSIVYNNLGTLYFEWGNFDLAFKYFEEAIILNPKNTKFYSTFLSLIPFCNKEIGYYKQHLQKYRESINPIKNLNNKNYII